MSTIVYYYSHNGSNRYLATKLARDLNCEIEEIKPRIDSLVLMLMRINIGNHKLNTRVEDYDLVILCGPVWMGSLIVPLKNFIKKHIHRIQKLIFVTCCGSSFEEKDGKYGHNRVFNAVRNLSGERCLHCEAFPIGLVLTEEEKKDTDSELKYRLSDDNFTGIIVELYDALITRLKRV